LSWLGLENKLSVVVLVLKKSVLIGLEISRYWLLCDYSSTVDCDFDNLCIFLAASHNFVVQDVKQISYLIKMRE